MSFANVGFLRTQLLCMGGLTEVDMQYTRWNVSPIQHTNAITRNFSGYISLLRKGGSDGDAIKDKSPVDSERNTLPFLLGFD